MQRQKRKSTKSISSHPDKDFNYYLENLRNSHKLINANGTDIAQETYERKFLSLMFEKWNQHKSDCILMEVLTGLQASLQSICELMLLLDRVEFLKENNFHCSLRKVTNDLLSPRCFALIATKSTQ